MFEFLEMWIGREFYNFYFIKFSGRSLVKISVTNGTDICVNTIRAQHNGGERMVVISSQEFTKIMLFEGSGLSFDVHEAHLSIHGIDITLLTDQNKIPCIETIERLINQPSVEEESENQAIYTHQLALLLKYVQAVGSHGFKMNTFNDKPTLFQDYDKAWKVLLGCPK